MYCDLNEHLAAFLNDPYWSNVVLLLKNNGVNGGNNNTFLDSSSNNFTITRNGNVTQGRFGPAASVSSGYFDGNGGFLNFTNQNFTGNITAECWFYQVANSVSYAVLFGANGSSAANNTQLYITNTGELSWVDNGVVRINPVGTANKNTWNHIAFVRNGTTATIFLNGVSIGTGTSSGTISIDRINSIGNVGTPANYQANAYYSLIRISNTARYTSNFTPSTSYTAAANTVLFLQFNNASIYDATGKSNVETVSSAAVSTAWTKFGQASISLGTNNYLASTASLGMGTGDFTFECHFRLTSHATFFLLDSSTNGGLSIYYNVGGPATSGNALVVSRSYVSNAIVHTITLSTGTDYYLQVQRSGSISYMYLNGSLLTSATDTQNYATGGVIVGFGRGTSYYAPGYIFDLRITKGIARPNVVPTAPFQAN